MITTVIADGKSEYEFIEYLKKRAQSSDKNVIPVVSEILENVRAKGDAAVRNYTLKFDGKAPERAEIPAEEIDAIIEKCDTKLIETIKKARLTLPIFISAKVSRAGLQQRTTALSWVSAFAA